MLIFLSLSFRQKAPLKYTKVHTNAPSNGYLTLNTDGTYFSLESGGCDGKLEGKGKWKFTKDTLLLWDVEMRIMNDPWKKTEGEARFLVKKDSLIPFSVIDHKAVYNRDQCYRKAKK
jgi:hypothetical protein